MTDYSDSYFQLRRLCSQNENKTDASLVNKLLQDVTLAQLDNVDIDNNETLLHCAAARGDTVMVDCLLKAGVNANVLSGYDSGDVQHYQRTRHWTALHFAAFAGHTSVIEKLLDFGVSVDQRDAFGGTALQWATVGQHRLCAITLLARGADVNAVCEDGWAPLSIAVSRNYTSLAHYYLDNCPDIDVNILEGNTRRRSSVLALAVYNGDIELTKKLHARGANVNLALSETENTPLFFALTSKLEGGKTQYMFLPRKKIRIEFVELLLSFGASVDVQNEEKDTPLHLILRHFFSYKAENAGYWRDFVVLLLHNRANIYAIDRYEKTPLSIVMSSEHNDDIKAYFCRQALFNVCLGLVALDLPVLVVLKIAESTLQDIWKDNSHRMTSVAMWNVAKLVKHF